MSAVTATTDPFGTNDIRGPIGEEVTPSLTLDLGRALAATGVERVVVGRDTRASGKPLADVLVGGLTATGVDVVRLGVVSTPTVARAVAWNDADAGVSITASHNPPADNGLKFWTPNGRAFDADRRGELIAALEEPAQARSDGIGTATTWDGAVERHVREIERAIVGDESSTGPLDGQSIVVDVGNGAGGLTADVLRQLGAAVQTLNADPNGNFPGRPSEPTADSCRSLSEVVAATRAELGIAHDGDADRTMAVTANGEFVGGDRLLALFARETAGTGDRVAVPVNTSLAVDDALAAVGAEAVRTPVGTVHVARQASESGVVFGGEPSGAWIWPDEILCPDGPFAACRLAVMIAERGSLADLLPDLGDYTIRRESVRTDRKELVEEAAAARIREAFGAVEALDGVRVESGDAWALVRASGTEPLVRLTVEAPNTDRADDLLDRVRSIVEDVLP